MITRVGPRKLLRGSSLRRHELIFFFIILLLVFINSSITIITFRSTTTMLTNALIANSKLVGVLYKIDNSYQKLVLNLQDLVVSVDRNKLSALYNELTNLKNYNQLTDYYSKSYTATSDAQAVPTQALSSALASVDSKIDKIVDLLIAQKQEDAQNTLNDLRNNELKRIQGEISAFITSNERLINQLIQDVEQRKAITWMRTLIFNFVIVAGIILLVYFFDKRVTKPLMQLTRKFDEINSGNLSINLKHLEQDTVKEVNILILAADTMRIRLLNSFEAIQQHNDALEQRIQERTAELYKQNESLNNAMEALKIAQLRLINAEKQTFITKLAQNLLHRINTPLGNAIMALDLVYTNFISLYSVLNTEDFQEVNTSFQLILKSQFRIKETMDSLNAMLAIDRSEQPHRIVPQEIIEEQFEKVRMTQPYHWHLLLETMNPSGDGDVNDDVAAPFTLTYRLQEKNLTLCMESLFRYLLHVHDSEQPEKTTILKIIENEKSLCLVILDSELDKNLDNFDSLEAYTHYLAREDNINLDLAFVIHCVNTGMDGSVDLILDSSDQKALLITLPTLEDSNEDL